ncbi:TRAP transporter fused permease subunit [Mesorhizobium sp. CAU 1732]|uniref:TRAP transporter permease n=1 Tax=Mesorhizobium sp. CAU 1732 TaxID=3140358 RepID=UPI003261D0AC
MTRPSVFLLSLYQSFLLVGGIIWAANFLPTFGVSLIEAEWLGPYLGVAVAAAFLVQPYGERPGVLEIGLGFISIACWVWLALNYQFWILDIAGYTPSKYIPAILAILIMMEAIRKICGLSITLLVWVLLAYGLFGFLLEPPLQADRVSPQALSFYLYSDTNAIPGLVLVIIASIVLAFIVLGKLMEVSGATQFFTDVAMALMGHRRGGPAKVAILASTMFGSISSSPVSNIMSTGIVTIPLMRRIGFRPHNAAAIEAVASTGGQITPPVMGATAFLIAEFLQVSYSEVVMAALLPAILYYLCLFVQVDAVSERDGLQGMKKSELPRVLPLLAKGWVFVLPLVVLIYLIFWANTTPGFAALVSAAILLVFALAIGRMRTLEDWRRLIFDGGAAVIPLVLIAGAAGVVVGVMNITGLGQSLSFVLARIGENWGLFGMLLITAVLSIILGMGMPSTAIYIILAAIIAPALVLMGVDTMGAHLFIFYFGILSFLTPPVAVSSFVAAGLAGADMWKTGWAGMRFSFVAYLVPFIWVYNPALLLNGTPGEIVIVILTTVGSIMLIARAMAIPLTTPSACAWAALQWVAAGLVGISSIVLGSNSVIAGMLGVAALGWWTAATFFRDRPPQLAERG